MNEDGELEMAYRTQQDLNKLLEQELQRLQKVSEVRETELQTQLNALKAETERQHKLLGQNLSADAKFDAAVQHELSRLAAENLDLREQIDALQDKLKKLKCAIKVYTRRLRSSEVMDIRAELEREMAAEENIPAVKHNESRELSGMFDYQKEEEHLLVRNLITDMKPSMVLMYTPTCLPAYILFMCMRHTDYMNDDEKVRSLLASSINSIKKVIKKRNNDIETIAMWLSNTCRLLNNLRQYSGDKAFQKSNTPKQNEQCLRNFDLSEYRQILTDLAVWIYQGLVRHIEARLQPVIVGAILENEAISGLTTGKPTGFRRATSSSVAAEDMVWTPDDLITLLSEVTKTLMAFDVDVDLVKQLLKQLFYLMSANALNNLLLRKDMCHWMKGMQIRFNLSQLEQWLREQRLHDGGALDVMEPIIEATQLLQARKTDDDVSSICDMCSHLTTPQIIKILNLYTPVNEYEERVPISFIRKIKEQLSLSREQERLPSSKEQSQSLLMDTKLMFAVSFPFNPSPVSLETIEAPTQWGLHFLRKV
jgi:myosin-5